ncbi:glutamine synthetase [Aplysia californica]|uniref:Lengsin n=1 Tax=Aplysia californica TaxID=6500 RepID=A0ABM1VPC2_APLCA|nr:glutamine synthetase [Aplysia californica]
MSPDLNLIEHYLDHIQRELNRFQPRPTKALQLQRAIPQIGANGNMVIIHRLLRSMANRCQAIELFLEFMDNMKNMGVLIKSVQTDSGPLGFEMTCAPCDGILTGDNTSRLRNALEVYLKTKGYEISYLSIFSPNTVPLVQHYNFSLWNSDGTNAMVPIESAQGPNGLSDMGRHFLNGLCHHGPALTAFALPTLHCYRSSVSKVCPSYFDYGCNDRSKCFRLKGNEDNPLFEFRQPSPQANPYLVFASVVAAGIDGINRKLEMPDPALPVPGDLPSALSALKKDHVVMEAMGEELVNAFVYTKTTHEIEPLMAGGTASDEEMLKREMAFY